MKDNSPLLTRNQTLPDKNPGIQSNWRPRKVLRILIYGPSATVASPALLVQVQFSELQSMRADMGGKE